MNEIKYDSPAFVRERYANPDFYARGWRFFCGCLCGFICARECALNRMQRVHTLCNVH